MQNCLSETGKTFEGCLSVCFFVLMFYFTCSTAEIKNTVLFQFYLNCAGTVTKTQFATHKRNTRLRTLSNK